MRKFKNFALAEEQAWLKAAAKEIKQIKGKGSADYKRDPILGDEKKKFNYYWSGPYARTIDSLTGSYIPYKATERVEWENLYMTYRYRHVAYSLLLGSSLKEIEPKNHADHGLNTELLAAYSKKLADAVALWEPKEVAE